MKRLLVILFAVVANFSLLAHTAVPHHHHIGHDVCVEHHDHDDSRAGDTQECTVKDLILRSESAGAQQFEKFFQPVIADVTPAMAAVLPDMGRGVQLCRVEVPDGYVSQDRPDSHGLRAPPRR